MRCKSVPVLVYATVQHNGVRSQTCICSVMIIFSVNFLVVLIVKVYGIIMASRVVFGSRIAMGAEVSDWKIFIDVIVAKLTCNDSVNCGQAEPSRNDDHT